MNITDKISDLYISTRLFNICNSAKITTLEELFRLDYFTLAKYWGMGVKTLEEINRFRIKFGYKPLHADVKIKNSINIRNGDNLNTHLNELFSVSDRNLMKMEIHELDLSFRISNVLQKNGINTIGDFIKSNIPPEKFQYLRNVGAKTIIEYKQLYNSLRQRVRKYHYFLNKDLNDPEPNQKKLLTGLNISFALFNALASLGVYELKDIVNLDITPRILHEKYLLNSVIIERFPRRLRRLELIIIFKDERTRNKEP